MEERAGQAQPLRSNGAEPTIVVTGGIHYDTMLRLMRLPCANDRLSVEGMTLAPGGMGGNVAATFARLGGNVRFAGAFTRDEDGIALQRDLEIDGVDCSFASTREGLSWRGFILVGEEGQRAIIGGWPPAQELERAPGRPPGLEEPTRYPRWKGLGELLAGLIDKPGLFDPPVHGFSLPSNFVLPILPKIPADLPIFIDVETGHFEGLETSQIWEVLCRARLVFGNEENLIQLASRLGVEDVATLAEMIGGTTIQTRGDRGCAIYDNGTCIPVPGFAVQPVDTTGAGDSFAASFALGYLRGWDLERAARYANAVAALSTTGLGSRAGVPCAADVERFIEEARH
ncbi:sugar kinase [soil metagenome]